MRGGWLGGQEVAAEREWGPADGGDKWRERIGGIGGVGRWKRESSDELKRARVENSDGATSREGEET